MSSDGMHQDCTLRESAENTRFFHVYTGKISLLSTDFLSVQFWCMHTINYWTGLDENFVILQNFKCSIQF